VADGGEVGGLEGGRVDRFDDGEETAEGIGGVEVGLEGIEDGGEDAEVLFFRE
jgi:hypothetical protein